MRCEHNQDLGTESGKCDYAIRKELEIKIVELEIKILKYRTALIATGCNNVLCDEYKRVCRLCPIHNRLNVPEEVVANV